MESRFRKLVLQQIEGIVEKQEPSGESLLRLLQVATPEFSNEDLANKSVREKSFRSLKALVHPDKHPSETTDTVTPLFQAIQSFYDKYCVVIAQGNNKNKRKRSSHSPASVKYPLQFHVKDQWSYLDVVKPNVPTSTDDTGLIARVIAYRCINFRGAIAHGKRTEISCSPSNTNILKTVKEVFVGFDGAKVLASIDAIKEELMNRGPVVSNSFVLCQAFLNACEHSSSFATSQVNQIHPLVIVGWKLSAFGEMWLARSIDGSAADIPIAFGQFSIDEEVLAPINSFENTPWQDETKAFGIHIGNADAKWRSWPGINIHLPNKGLSKLAKVLGCGFVEAVNCKTRVVLRDKDKIGHSRFAYLTEISWSEDNAEWKVKATFTE